MSWNITIGASDALKARTAVTHYSCWSSRKAFPTPVDEERREEGWKVTDRTGCQSAKGDGEEETRIGKTGRLREERGGSGGGMRSGRESTAASNQQKRWARSDFWWPDSIERTSGARLFFSAGAVSLKQLRFHRARLAVLHVVDLGLIRHSFEGLKKKKKKLSLILGNTLGRRRGKAFLEIWWSVGYPPSRPLEPRW